MLCALACLLGSGIARAESEASVKAAYLFNFARLVEWPAAAFPSATAPLVIGIVGRDPVGDELVRGCAGANVGRHSIEVRRISTAEVRGCHVVYVPEAERGEAVVAAALGAPVLIVGEAEDFVRRGGAIGFVREGGTVKFEANPGAATRNGLTVSAKLLRVARSMVNR